MRNIKFYLFIFLTFFLKISTLRSFEVKILDDLDSIIRNNKIHIQIRSDDSQAICKDNIIFSIDNPKIRIKNWAFDSETVIKHVGSFRNEKKVFFSDFSVQVNFLFLVSEQEILKKRLEASNLYISCLVVDNRDFVYPKCFVKKIGHGIEKKLSDINFQDNMVSGTYAYNCFESSLLVANSVYSNFISSDTSNKIENKIQKDTISKVAEFRFIYMFLFLIILFSFYFFISEKKDETWFRFVVGLLLLTLGIIFLIKVCLIKNHWPFEKINDPGHIVSRAES